MHPIPYTPSMHPSTRTCTCTLYCTLYCTLCALYSEHLNHAPYTPRMHPSTRTTQITGTLYMHPSTRTTQKKKVLDTCTLYSKHAPLNAQVLCVCTLVYVLYLMHILIHTVTLYMHSSICTISMTHTNTHSFGYSTQLLCIFTLVLIKYTY